MSAYAGKSARESGSASQKPYAHAGHACESARHSMGKTGPFRQFLCSKQHAKNNAQYAPLFENCPPLRRSRSRKNPWVSLWITAGGRVQCPHFQPNIHIVLMFSHSVKGFAGGGPNLLDAGNCRNDNARADFHKQAREWGKTVQYPLDKNAIVSDDAQLSSRLRLARQ